MYKGAPWKLLKGQNHSKSWLHKPWNMSNIKILGQIQVVTKGHWNFVQSSRLLYHSHSFHQSMSRINILSFLLVFIYAFKTVCLEHFYEWQYPSFTIDYVSIASSSWRFQGSWGIILDKDFSLSLPETDLWSVMHYFVHLTIYKDFMTISAITVNQGTILNTETKCMTLILTSFRT